MSTQTCQCASKVRDILAAYPTGRRETLIPILQDVQDVFGFLPEDALDIIGKHVNISTSKIYGVATFYNQFRLQPVGKHIVRVCRGTACHVRGSKLLLDALADQLHVEPGATSPDGEYTLETVACIGACSIAPVITVDDDFHGGVQKRDIAKILKQYREE